VANGRVVVAAASQGWETEAMKMLTIRTLGGIALLLFGTTFLWLTPAFATQGIATEGVLWATTRVLAFVTIAGFVLATWGLFHRAAWWERSAIASALLGLVVLVPYWIAAARAGETAPAFNVMIHALGSASVLGLLLVPELERWVDSHVMGVG
jgi:hypothetical protein